MSQIRVIKRANHPSLKDAIKAGYDLEYLSPNPMAKAAAYLCGSTIRHLPKFVKTNHA